MGHILRDLHYAWRGLTRAPLFTIVALVSIALGIGANTAIFTLVDEVLLRMLPVKNPEQLVLLNGARNHYGSNSGGSINGLSDVLSFPMYEDFRDNFVDRGQAAALPRVTQPVDNPAPHPPIFSGMFARRTTAMIVGVPGDPGDPGDSVQSERVPGEMVTGTFFQVLGVGAAIGRVITPADDKVRGDGRVAVLGFNYWRTRFGADPGVVGRHITINNHTYTIVGVSQAGFDGVDIGYVPSVRVPIMMKAQVTPNWDDLIERRSRWVNVFARMKPGVTIDQLKPALQPFFRGLLKEEVKMPAFSRASAYTREQFLNGEIGMTPAAQGRSPIRQRLSQPLGLLMGIVAGVLLIACANVASLLIARATARQKEIAVRLALGASRRRIVSQLLVESVLLAAAGGVMGLVIAAWTTKFPLGYLPTSDTPHVISGSVIANESFAKHYFGDQDPIGRHIGFGGNPGTPTPVEIVGIVKDSKYTGVRDEIPRTLFFPLLQERTPSSIVVYVRTAGDPSAGAPNAAAALGWPAAFGAAQRAVRDVDSKVPVYNLRTLEHQIDQSLLNDRIVATLSTAFGVLATLLAVIGLYGVMAYTVARRTREIGVRMALGAVRGDVIWLVMREVLTLVGGGLIIGLVASWGVNRAISSQLYGVTASDPLTIAGAAALLCAVASIAGYIPARRATRVNPVLALRYE